MKKIVKLSESLSEKSINLFNDYKNIGLHISNFPKADYAGEITIKNNDYSELPVLELHCVDGIEKNASSYIITVDGIVVKIGAAKDGVKGSVFGQYLYCLKGNPSERSIYGYLFILEMLKMGKKVEVYYKSVKPIVYTIPTICYEIRRNDVRIASSEIEKENLNAYKIKSKGNVPLLNLKEKGEKFPQEVREIKAILTVNVGKNNKKEKVVKTKVAVLA